MARISTGLRYVSDRAPGLRRRRVGKGFVYYDARNRRITDAATIARIRAIVIPPAWRQVWICTSARGHLQAVGRDARGRKQYRYHPSWRAERERTKFDRLVAFARALPRIRRRVARDLALPGLPRDKVLATVVRLLESARIRVGNEEYAQQNGTFGLTTLRTRHARVVGPRVTFRFRGKGGLLHEVETTDPRVARIIRRCQDLPGQELFQYLDEDGRSRTIDSADVNRYLREVSGDDFTAKDFRTWGGTVLACLALAQFPPPRSEIAAKRTLVRVVAEVAEALGNTPTVCRKSYIHPDVVTAFAAGHSFADLAAARSRSAIETAVAQLLRPRRLAAAA